MCVCGGDEKEVRKLKSKSLKWQSQRLKIAANKNVKPLSFILNCIRPLRPSPSPPFCGRPRVSLGEEAGQALCLTTPSEYTQKQTHKKGTICM